MKGKHSVSISNSRLRYKFELARNITVVSGDSGTGKTTLFEMISAYARQKEKSGVKLVCDKPCIALHPDSDWRSVLQNTSDSIVFIDEESEYMTSDEFASVIKRTDNYYVFFTRENLHNLPYSVEEIYAIHTSGKLHSFRKLYKRQAGCRYSALTGKKHANNFSTLLTEDSRSGFQFFNAYFDGNSVKCESAGSNSSIYQWLLEDAEANVMVVADGAAFGAEINRVLNLQKYHPNISVCLPESFEWMILKSGLIRTDDIETVLEKTADFVESSEFFSWEQFFTDYLVQNTKDTYYRYSKHNIGRFYLVRDNMEKIIAIIRPY